MVSPLGGGGWGSPEHFLPLRSGHFKKDNLKQNKFPSPRKCSLKTKLVFDSQKYWLKKDFT